MYQKLKKKVYWGDEAHKEFLEILRNCGKNWYPEGCISHSNKTKDQCKKHFLEYYYKALQDPKMPDADLFIKNHDIIKIGLKEE